MTPPKTARERAEALFPRVLGRPSIYDIVAALESHAEEAVKAERERRDAAIAEAVEAKETEWRQVAALACLDIDTLFETANDESMSADGLRGQIKLIHKMKEALINDAAGRELRFNAASMLFNLVAKGTQL